MLFHGTRTTDPKVIWGDKEESFNINYTSDTNLLGRGIYFAQSPEYSVNYSSPCPEGKQMFCCLVLVGDSETFNHQQLSKTIKDTNIKDTVKKIKYESNTAFLQGSNVYVVYKNRRAYPLYLITY